MKRIFSRGLNYHGQCGLGRNVLSSIEKFTELEMQLPIIKVETYLGSTLAMDKNSKTIYYWGFNWDIRSFYRTAMFLNAVPNFMLVMKVEK
jgi:alpha-tubulin suppressor-like RCC1 family protein